MYQQIAQDLMRKIEAGAVQPDGPGVLKPGAQLPNEEKLRDEYATSRNTVREAIRWLTARGLVVTRPGLGGRADREIDCRDSKSDDFPREVRIFHRPPSTVTKVIKY